MATRTTREVKVAGGNFATVEEALAAIRAKTGNGTSASSVAGNPNVQRQVRLLPDGSGIEVIDIWASDAAKTEYMNGAKAALAAAGAVAGQDLNGVTSVKTSESTV